MERNVSLPSFNDANHRRSKMQSQGKSRRPLKPPHEQFLIQNNNNNNTARPSTTNALPNYRRKKNGPIASSSSRPKTKSSSRNNSLSMSSFGTGDFDFKAIDNRAQTAFQEGFNVDRMLFDQPSTKTSAASTAASLFNKSATASLSPIIKQATSAAAKGYRLYNQPEFEKKIFDSVLSHNGTWQNKREEVSSEKNLVKRSDISDLQQVFQSAISFVEEHQATPVTGSISSLEQEYTRFYQSSESSHKLLTSTNSKLKSPFEFDLKITTSDMTRALFKQKWTDSVLSEIESQLLVSFLEQGEVVSGIRDSYARSFSLMQNLYESLMNICNKSVSRNYLLETQMDVLLNEKMQAENNAKRKYKIEIKKVKSDYELKSNECARQVTEAQEQVSKSNEVMKALNGLFKQMSDDSDAVKKSDVNQAMLSVERRCEAYKEELEKLRPLARELKEVTGNYTTLKSSFEEQEAEVAALRQELAEKNELLSQVLLKQQKLLEIKEVASVLNENESSTENNTSVIESSPLPSTSTANGTGSLLCIKCKNDTSVEGDTSGTSATSGGGTDGKKKLCRGYRLMLPKIKGRPVKSLEWTLCNIRSILLSKALEDDIMQSTNSLRTRFPAYCYAWFASMEHKEQEVQSQQQPDTEDNKRWCFYYGLKAYGKEYPEAALCFSLLDGDIELLQFTLNCIQTIIQKINPNLWGESSYNYFQYHENQPQSFPNNVYLNIEQAMDVMTSLISSSSSSTTTSEEELEFMRNFLESKSCAATDENGDPDLIDMYTFIICMAQEFKQEVAQRFGAIKLMFQTITTSESSSSTSMDMEQFTSMMTSIVPDVSLIDVASLYLATLMSDNASSSNVVSYDSFFAAADQLQFFSRHRAQRSAAAAAGDDKLTKDMSFYLAFIKKGLDLHRMPFRIVQEVHGLMNFIENNDDQVSPGASTNAFRKLLNLLWHVKMESKMGENQMNDLQYYLCGILPQEANEKMERIQLCRSNAASLKIQKMCLSKF